MSERKQISESFLIGIILATVGGFLDAYTYICRDGVFANAQTGNIVLLGIKVSQGDFWGGLHYLIPIFAFMLGVLSAETVRKWDSNKTIHWRQVILLFEIVILIIISFVPKNAWCNMLANVMVSFVCSLQVQSFRKVNGKAIATTMCTGNLRSTTEHIYKFLTKKDSTELRHALQYCGIIAFFVIGAILGSILTNQFGITAILAACVGLVMAFAIMFIKP